ncbi:hypothetical protein CA2015_2958 [Cyclobacterium amurskyense]|uniref:Uncharacterized protein n=1 Tax=Cyclobacterium amurskyense TaxID=320787 RepID=A0A0H4PHL7_9BACT|nr:hypothetical protein CA2015_2958 [Cyclobacterium amurskyense]
MVEKSYDAIVVGSGPNGLVTAIALFHFGVFIMTSDHPLLLSGYGVTGCVGFMRKNR